MLLPFTYNLDGLGLGLDGVGLGLGLGVLIDQYIYVWARGETH